MRKGLIKISDEMYRGGYAVVHKIFKDVRPTHIEFRYWENDTWYLYGECDFFDELKEGEAVPQYDVLMTSHDNGEITHKFVRV